MRAQNHLTEETEDTRSGRRRSARGPGPVLIVAWCRDEPRRVGEVLGDPSQPEGIRWIFGRQDGGAPTLGSVRQRPGHNAPAAPWTSMRISAQQLAVTRRGDALEVENLGRRALLLRGVPVDRLRARAGDVLELRNQLLLLVAPRPPTLPALSTVAPQPFGEPDPDGIIGESPAAWELRRRLAFLGRRAGHVLITGPSGTGKELAAAALHRRAGRGPWVSRNAATLPEGLLDAELYGNVRNYPNPGMAERPGLIGAADGGTLFLDELAELPAEAQAHLLRVLDQGEYQRLGEARVRRSVFRLIAATNRPPDALKHDLAARFAHRLELPPLDQRREDIPLLAAALLRRIAQQEPDLAERYAPDGDPRLSPRLVAHLLTHRWTTHTRELQALLWRALAESTGDEIDLPDAEPAPPPPEPSPDLDRWVGQPAASLPPEVIQAALDACNGRQEEAWRRLGLDSRYVLNRLIRKHGLTVRRTGG